MHAPNGPTLFTSFVKDSIPKSRKSRDVSFLKGIVSAEESSFEESSSFRSGLFVSSYNAPGLK